jgi:hypothetical protein
MYHYNTNKQALDIISEYNKFTKEYNNYIESISDESEESVTFKRKKFLLDQLVQDLNRSHKKVDPTVFEKKTSKYTNKVRRNESRLFERYVKRWTSY